MEKFLKEHCSDPGFEQTYEYFFNLSQVYLKDQCTDLALKTLKDSFEKSKVDDSFADDQIRFKVQEMHALNKLVHQYSAISYKTDAEKNQCWFDFSKTIRNNILIELNINALSEIYDLNTTIFKDVIGSLNWKKFAERIKMQLKENQNLT